MEEKMQEESKPCACGKKPSLVLPCSGAADVGEISDRAARKVSMSSSAKMFCLAGVGGRVKPIMQTVEAAERVIAVDGCSLDCARATLEQAGFSGFDHIRVTDLGMEKGKSAPNEERITRVSEEIQSLMEGGR